MKYSCIIGYGTLGKKIFEVLSKKDSKIKIFNRSHKKLKNVLDSKKFTTVDEAFRNSNIIFFIVKDHRSIEYFFKKSVFFSCFYLFSCQNTRITSSCRRDLLINI